jgi:hypothetical protein
MVKVTAGEAQAVTTRDSMYAEVLRILHHNETSLPGISDAYVVRETAKVEGPDTVRLAIQVECVSLHLAT